MFSPAFEAEKNGQLSTMEIKANEWPIIDALARILCSEFSCD